MIHGTGPRAPFGNISSVPIIRSVTGSGPSVTTASSRIWRSTSAPVTRAGPASDSTAVRLASSVISEPVHDSRQSLLVVSFAAFGVTDVVHELERAARRGVRIDLILESTADHGGTLHGPIGAAEARAWGTYPYDSDPAGTAVRPLARPFTSQDRLTRGDRAWLAGSLALSTPETRAAFLHHAVANELAGAPETDLVVARIGVICGVPACPEAVQAQVP
jgi:hypothetical protein